MKIKGFSIYCGRNCKLSHQSGDACVFSRVLLFVILCTVTHQTPLSLGFSMQEYWSELPFPSPGVLPDLGTESSSSESLASIKRLFYFSDRTAWVLARCWSGWKLRLRTFLAALVWLPDQVWLMSSVQKWWVTSGHALKKKLLALCFFSLFAKTGTWLCWWGVISEQVDEGNPSWMVNRKKVPSSLDHSVVRNEPVPLDCMLTWLFTREVVQCRALLIQVLSLDPQQHLEAY